MKNINENITNNNSSNSPTNINEILGEIKNNTINNIKNVTKTIGDIISKASNKTKNKLNFPKTIKIPIINKHYNSYLIISLFILIPILFIILLIYLFIRYRKKSYKMKKIKENYDLNRIHVEKPKINQKYNPILNTSGINNVPQSQDNLSEIKIQNMKEEMNNINANNTNSNNINMGGSSGRRKREKKKGEKRKKNDIGIGFDMKEGKKEMENEIKEQIKQFVIEEHNNNSVENNNE